MEVARSLRAEKGQCPDWQQLAKPRTFCAGAAGRGLGAEGSTKS